MNDKNTEQLKNDDQRRVAQGEQNDKIIEDLRTDGFTISEAINMVRSPHPMDLKDAHQAVASHSAWQDIGRNAEPLHNEIEKALKIATRLGYCKSIDPPA